jgi:uroporphyrin-3 C-methyltransferase
MTEHEQDKLQAPSPAKAADSAKAPAQKPSSDRAKASDAKDAGQSTQPGGAKKPSKAAGSKAEKPPRRALLRRLAWLLLVVAVVAIVVAAGYGFWQVNQRALAAFTLQQQSLETRLEESQRQIAQLQVGNQESSAAWQQAVSKLETLVIDSAQRLNRVANRNENRWPLEEALTLTRLAQQRLQLDASALVATGLLRSADEILSTLDQAAVLPLRRQLAIDLLALESVASADVNGLYFALDALAGQIKALSWVPKPSLPKALPVNDTPLTGFWHSLKQIVVIQRLDVPMQAPALMNDFERWRQHQLLLIDQSQLALLARNQDLFDVALSQTRDALAQMASQFPIEVWQQQLTAMQTAVLNPQWPDLQGSRAAIEIYLSEQTAPAVEVTQ